MLAMAEAGADLIELGVPFSDPIADGPTIQRASERALAGGTSLRRVLELAKRLRARSERAAAADGLRESLLRDGRRATSPQAAAEAGVDGVIVPDLPPEEGADLYGAAAEAGLDGVLLAAPTTTPARLAPARRAHARLPLLRVADRCHGRARRARCRPRGLRARAPGPSARVPVCVGFGVSTPEHAAAIGRYADGVVVGSAIVDRIERAATPDEAVDSVARFVAALKAPLRKADGVN